MAKRCMPIAAKAARKLTILSSTGTQGLPKGLTVGDSLQETKKLH
eukprot:CAMPEP_0197679524 /NCGR_PEP_ID=MMETSP1338-20131121/91819_1 /TAXON_ID=43686 ORGANISM="Pelagodinium beii, Strain RCC1491" /NCGR_SAMPLE_ID=MMETSP1338 /ASSEMBLY_ACC=CAM_ASM_000754 /LENGTH=44 /DNA_ID= /DNA_START= /DNA_END= /DNA_ORIENTATION=